METEFDNGQPDDERKAFVHGVMNRYQDKFDGGDYGDPITSVVDLIADMFHVLNDVGEHFSAHDLANSAIRHYHVESGIDKEGWA